MNQKSIQGLELSKRYYHDCILPLLGKWVPAHAAGLIGFGSEVLGYDDLHSQDHDFGPRVILFLPDDRRQEVSEKLFQTLDAQIPKLFLGFKTRFMNERLAISITSPERYFQFTLGTTLPLETCDWLLIPEQRLLESTSGEIFADHFGTLSTLRNSLRYFPFNIWTYRVAYALDSLSWDYDLIADCARRNKPLGMKLATAKTVERLIKLTFLIHRHYCPSYGKWVEVELKKIHGFHAAIHKALTADSYEEVISLIEGCLNVLYELMKAHWKLPTTPPQHKSRFCDLLDAKELSRILIETLEGELKTLVTHLANAPYGAVDQWCTQQDFLLESEYFAAFKDYYKSPKSALFRDPWETFI